MKFHLFLVLTLLCATTRAGGNNERKKSSKVCNHVSCCTANEDASLHLSFLLEFAADLDTPICANLQEKLENDFVISYNYMTNLNCDAPCFRRARAARIVAAPANAFAACSSSTYKEDHKYPLRGEERRKLVNTLSDNALIIELELEQAGECTTALDGQVGHGDAAHPDEYKHACGRPAWAFDYSWHKDICHYKDPEYDYYDDPAVCCCACHADRSLSEEDLTAKHAKSHTLSKLGADLISVRELYERDVCYEETVELKSSFLFIFSGENVEISDTTELFDTVAGSYNALSFDNCDELGRQITGGTVDTTPERRKLQGGGRANRFPAGACRNGGCVGSDASGQAQCPPNQCGSTSGSNFFDFGNRRRRNLGQQNKVDVERRLGAMTPVTTKPSELISDQCLCPVHQPDATGTAPESTDFVDRFNQVIQRYPDQFAELGELQEVIEFKSFPSAGPPKDFYLWLPVYIKGNPCAFDYMEQEMLSELILESYNDIVVEDCDKPLFRQILSAWTWQDPNLNCYMQEHVVHVKVEARCHGYCNHKNPLFSPYKKHDEYRRLRGEKEEKDVTAPYNPEDFHVDFSQNALAGKDMMSPPSSTSIHQSPARQLGEYSDDYVHEEPGPDGICLVQGEADNYMHPTVAGVEERVNSAYPTAAVSYISILSEPLCRCEGPYEYLYYYGYGKGSNKNYPDSLDEYYTMNGIYIVPKHNKPCSYHRNLLEDQRDLQGGYVFPCYSH